MRRRVALLVFLLSYGGVGLCLSCSLEVIETLEVEFVRGIVRHAYGGAPVKSAVVEIYGVAKLGPSVIRRVSTGADGRFEIKDVPKGKYEIRFISKDFGSRSAPLIVGQPRVRGEARKSIEIVVVLSRGDGPCGRASVEEVVAKE